MEPKLNFNSMPDKSSNGTEAGMSDLIIMNAVSKLSKAKKQMLVITVAPIANQKFTIDDYYTLFGTKEDGYPVEEFGQYKLRTLQEVTNTIPEGDYTLALIARMLKGKKFRAELIIEPYNGKDYLKVGFPESFEPYEEAAPEKPVVVEETEETEEKTDTEIAKEIVDAIEEDDEL